MIKRSQLNHDDAHNTFFVSPDVGRSPQIEEDEPAEVEFLSDK